MRGNGWVKIELLVLDLVGEKKAGESKVVVKQGRGESEDDIAKEMKVFTKMKMQPLKREFYLKPEWILP